MLGFVSNLSAGWRIVRPEMRFDSVNLSAMRLRVRDTLNPWRDEFADKSPEVERMLRDLAWRNEAFDVAVEPLTDERADAEIRFASPMPQGDTRSDEVVLDWYMARNKAGQAVTGPAMLVLDILQGGNMVARFVARQFSKHGIHAFVMHMPLNCKRATPGERRDWSHFLPSLRQAAGDARRSRDVIAALPGIAGSIGIQGTSLGGFIATVAASLDRAFDPVHIALAGGDVYQVLTKGKIDAARVHQRLRQAGFNDHTLRAELAKTEPGRLASRLNPKRTWVYSARHDQVVPAACSRELADAIGLPSSHRRVYGGCHYSCLLGAIRMMAEMRRTIRVKPDASVVNFAAWKEMTNNQAPNPNQIPMTNVQ